MGEGGGGGRAVDGMHTGFEILRCEVVNSSSSSLTRL